MRAVGGCATVVSVVTPLAESMGVRRPYTAESRAEVLNLLGRGDRPLRVVAADLVSGDLLRTIPLPRPGQDNIRPARRPILDTGKRDVADALTLLVGDAKTLAPSRNMSDARSARACIDAPKKAGVPRTEWARARRAGGQSKADSRAAQRGSSSAAARRLRARAGPARERASRRSRQRAVNRCRW
jgi:hypothetical protein